MRYMVLILMIFKIYSTDFTFEFFELAQQHDIYLEKISNVKVLKNEFGVSQHFVLSGDCEADHLKKFLNSLKNKNFYIGRRMKLKVNKNGKINYLIDIYHAPEGASLYNKE